MTVTRSLGRRWRRPRVAVLLVLAMLAPLAALAALTGNLAIESRAQQRLSADVEQDADALSALTAARALVVTEYVPSSALASAAAFHITAAQVKKVFGIDYPAQVASARLLVDRESVLRSSPTLLADLNRLHALRSSISSARAVPSAVVALFTGFTADIDSAWSARFADLTVNVGKLSDGTGLAGQRLEALSRSFALLTSATTRADTSNAVVSQPPNVDNVRRLIEANGKFAAATAGLAAGLGPRAAAAWTVWQRDPPAIAWEHTVTDIVGSALAGKRSPLSTNLLAYAAAFTREPRWLDDLTAVTAGASTDMRDITHREAAAAARAYRTELVIFAFSVLIAAGATVLLARAFVRPLGRLAASARRIAEGNFANQTVKAAGPREVADTILAVDEMTSVFSAVESFTVTLAEDPDAPSLDVPLPGRTGQALQTTLNRLRESVREAERQRVILHEMATHDALTGLLNRQAARAALSRELSRAQREATAVTVLYIDLDNLKAINDRYGHKAGDDAIRLTGQALRSAARGSDIVARVGGDEFLVAGPAGAHEEMQLLADRLRGAVAASRVAADGQLILLRCSVGLALSEPGDDVESLIHKADQALYAAKSSGRDRTAWHEELSSRVSG